jgi:hypothetical protein
MLNKCTTYAVYSIQDYQPLIPPTWYEITFDFNAVEKNKKSFYWYCVFGWLFVSLVGSLFHFTYHWMECNIVIGLLVAVNESVFEHLKILGLPIMLFWTCDYLRFGEGRKHLIAVTSALYSGIFFLLIFNIIVSQIGGFEELWFDIFLFILSAFVAQLTGWLCIRYDGEVTYYTMIFVDLLLFVTVCCHVFFTDSPPHLSWMFEDHRGFYGRPLVC